MANRLDLTGRKIIGSGKWAKIYLFKGKAVKVNNIYSKERISKEYEIQLNLYDAGISVPKPYGLIEVEVNSVPNFGLLMDRIKGKTYCKLKNSLLNKIFSSTFRNIDIFKIEREIEREIQKIRDLDFLINDRHNENVMVDKNKKIFLLDFDPQFCASPENLEKRVV